jgi:hypothetical protein
MTDIFRAMKAKKKRAVDPNAPPRPNLMTHDVKLRTAEQTIQYQGHVINQMQQRLNSLESKLKAQTDYLSVLHNKLSKR